MLEPIYLDYNATTPVDARVLDAMMPWFSDQFGNAASSHPFGRRALAAAEGAREQVADAIGASPSDVVWTSGATEANNLAIKGLADAAPSSRRRVLVAATEHKAVLDPASWLVERGLTVEFVPVDSAGSIDVETYEGLLGEDVALVSIMLANNETGAVAPIQQLAEVARSVGAAFHTDATQALGKLEVDVRTLGVDAASFSAHKVYGPKGVGALYVAPRTRMTPQVHGGGHERGLRSGTTNVPGVVGFGAAAELAESRILTDQAQFRRLTDDLLAAVQGRVHDVELVGPPTGRLANTLNLRFVGADAEAVMANAPSVAVSSGSACSSFVPSASHVLRAMGLTEGEAYECIRFSVGRPTSDDDVSTAAQVVGNAVERVRSLG